MEFIKTNQFRISNEREAKSTLMIPKQQKRTQKIKITCCKFSSQLETLTCGLSDGSLIQYTPKKFEKKRLTQTKQYETRRFTLPNMHKGEVKCLLNQKIFNQIFIISGSADRTLKIWDVDPKSKDIVQTLTGHSGTIVCITYSKKTDTIFTGSTDKSLRIWKQDQSRKFFLYPWYVCYQIISQFYPKKIESPVYPTSLDLHDGELNNFTLYLGDSLGNLHLIKQLEIPTESFSEQSQTAFELEKSNYGYHRLNINNILYVSHEHLIITTGYDQNLYAYETLSDKIVTKYSNPHKCVFRSVVWYEGMIVAADQEGSIYCIEINSDKGVEELRKYNTKIYQLQTVPGRLDIFVVTDSGVDSIRIIKGIKAVEGQSCHKGPIVDMFSLEPYKLTEKKLKEQAKIVTVSLDNTMRVWQSTDLSPLQMLPNPEKSQITTLFYLKRANLFVTGHDNGAVRLWNIQLQNSITVAQDNSPHAHHNSVTKFAEYIYVRANEDAAEFMFSTGYEGKVNVWQIFLKKSVVQSSLMSSTICPQLKFSFFPDDLQENPDQLGFQLFALTIWQPKSSSEDATILSAGSRGMVYFTKMFSYETFRKIKIHNDSINAMIIDENILFTGGFDKQIKLTSLDNFELLICLEAHDSSINGLMIIEETGHLVSKSSQGDIFFWDYPQQRIVKKIKEKKQKIMSFCIVDDLKMVYLGTEEAKIVSHKLDDLYDNHVNKGISSIKVEKMDEESLKKILADNQAELQKILNDIN